MLSIDDHIIKVSALDNVEDALCLQYQKLSQDGIIPYIKIDKYTGEVAQWWGTAQQAQGLSSLQQCSRYMRMQICFLFYTKC